MSGLRVFWLSPPLDGKGNSGNNRHHCDDKDRVKRPRRTWRHDLVREAVRGHACAFAERSVLCSFELHSTDRIAVATHPVRAQNENRSAFCFADRRGQVSKIGRPARICVDYYDAQVDTTFTSVGHHRGQPRNIIRGGGDAVRRNVREHVVEIDVRRNSDVQRGLHVHRRKSVICRSRHLSSGCCSDSVHR